MTTLKIKNYKHLLQYLNPTCPIILNISLWTHSSKRMRLSVDFNQIEKYFDKYMFDAHKHERLTFMTTQGEVHDYDMKQIRILKLDGAAINDPNGTYHTSSFKDLIQKIKGDRDIMLCFTLKPHRRKRMYLKAPYSQVERFFSHDMLFRWIRERTAFSFTAPNGKNFRFNKYNIEDVELESVVFTNR